MSADKDRIRLLNDQLRQQLPQGHAVMTPGIAALGSETVQRLERFPLFVNRGDSHRPANKIR